MHLYVGACVSEICLQFPHNGERASDVGVLTDPCYLCVFLKTRETLTTIRNPRIVGKNLKTLFTN